MKGCKLVTKFSKEQQKTYTYSIQSNNKKPFKNTETMKIN